MPAGSLKLRSIKKLGQVNNNGYQLSDERRYRDNSIWSTFFYFALVLIKDSSDVMTYSNDEREKDELFVL